MQSVRTTVAVNPGFDAGCELHQNLELLRLPFEGGSRRRFWLEQTELPKIVRNCGADLLISAGNFALRRSPVPQILLSRNSLYTSPDFAADLIRRGEYQAGSTLTSRQYWPADLSIGPTGLLPQ